MSCNPYTYAPRGRRGIGINQPQSGLNYPLVAPSADIQYLIADFYLAYDDLTQTRQHPLRIKWLYGIGCDDSAAPPWAPTPTHAADILITDAQDNAVFDTASLAGAVTFSTWCWGRRKNDAGCDDSYDYRVYEWLGAKAVCRLVVYQTWPPSAADIDADAVRNYAQHLAPENAVIDERAIYRTPKRVTSFILPALNNVKLTKTAVDFAAGYNIELLAGDTATSNLRNTQPVTINATPGAGLGKYTDCENPDIPIYRINGLTGPDILITAEKCLWLRTPTVVDNSGLSLTPVKINNHATQVIGSNCPACCTCDDYVELANYMNNTRDRYKTIGNAAKNVLLAHSDNITRWVDQRNCRLRTPIKVCMTPQLCPYIDVVAQYCNLCENCAEDVIIQMNFVAAGNSATIACGHTSVTTKTVKGGLYQLGGDWPTYTANLGKVDAGNSASVAFRLQFTNAVPTTVRLTATATTKNGDVLAGCSPGLDPASATVTKALYCTSDGKTVSVC